MIPFMALLLAVTLPDLAQLQHMTARFAPVKMRVDTSGLSAGDQKALPKLIEAARLMNDIFMTQLWSGNQAMYARLKHDTTPLGKARLEYFWLCKGPWSDLDDYAAFVPGAPPRKLPGANFYPEDMSKAEFEAWVKTLPEARRREAEGFFTVIRRDAHHKLTVVPYSQEYHDDLSRAAKRLREAAALTDNQSLRRFLNLRADAFLSNDYYASDVAWMDLDAPLDITIGPYEVYNDELFGYKAAYEAYVSLRDDKETERLKSFAGRLQEIEDHLPIEPRYRNPKLGALAPIRVVNEILAAGDGAHGVRTAAYNLPNDERVVHEKGSKRVMLKNVQEAKFHTALEPIAARVLPKAAQADVSFDAFFTHILAHELSHGIGPHQIKVGGRSTTARQELKELYSAIEEAKADVTGLFMLQYLYDHGMGGGAAAEHRLYTTFLASAFRSMRFGLTDAHGKGMALQFNYLSDKGAFVARPDGAFEVDYHKVKAAVRDLDHDLLTLEAEGNYAGARHMLDTLGVVRPAVRKALDSLQDIPVDIRPIDVTAQSIAPRH
jgi:Peptidase family M49